MAELEYERAADLLEAELGDEMVALSVEDGNCFGFNTVAASVWRALEVPRSLIELKNSLLDEFEVSPDQCDSELQELLGDLVEKKLVRTRIRPDSG